MASKANPTDTRRENLRRRTWGMRMALWTVLFAATGVFIVFVVLSGGNSDEDGVPESRFDPIHKFGTADYHSLAFNPTEENVVLFGHHGGVQMSQDAGENWETVIDEQGRDAMNLVYDPFSPETIFMAGHNVYYRSSDAGQSWQEVTTDLPGLDLHAFAASPAHEGRFYAFSAGYGLFQSDDAGSTWALAVPQAPQGTNSIVELPDGTLILGATDQGILRSDDGGATWTQSRNGIDVGAIYAVKGDPAGERLYAGTDYGVYVSTDGGSTWSKTSLDDTWVVAVGVAPNEPLSVLAINRNGQLYRSTDGGETWE
ncbi:MAG: hypothetical protein ABIU97_10565 [Dehalococcoidia bacterium]